jgi:hypothetical protein
MSIVRVKIGICEYYFEYETLDDIKNHFKQNGANSIGFDRFDIYDGNIKGRRIAVEDLTLEDVKRVQEQDKTMHSFLRGWRNKII